MLPFIPSSHWEAEPAAHHTHHTRHTQAQEELSRDMWSHPASLVTRLSGPTVSGSWKMNPALASEMAAPVCKERVYASMSVYTIEMLRVWTHTH